MQSARFAASRHSPTSRNILGNLTDAIELARVLTPELLPYEASLVLGQTAYLLVLLDNCARRKDAASNIDEARRRVAAARVARRLGSAIPHAEPAT